jgi:hypothetical protein
MLIGDMAMTTHRLIQIHNLEDTLSSKARIASKAALNAGRICNMKAAAHFMRKAQRLNNIAAKCRAHLWVGSC